MKGWVVEWSEEQQSFHTDTLENSLQRNLRAYVSGRASQYVILCLADSIDEASKSCDELRKLKKKN